MKFKIEKSNIQLGSAYLVSPQQIGLSLHLPDMSFIKNGDVVELEPDKIMVPQSAIIVQSGKRFEVCLQKDDVHDLRLPPNHGGSRFPEKSRFLEANSG